MAIRNPRHVFSADLETVERRLRELEDIERQSALEKGMLLKHVRDNNLTRGQWGTWLKGVGIDPSTATRYVQVYVQFGNHATSHDLPTSKLFELIKLPESVDRADFLAENDVAGMTVKELREAVKAEKEAAGLVKTKPTSNTSEPEFTGQQAFEDSPAFDEIPYGTVKKILQLGSEQRACFEELAAHMSGTLIADEFVEIKIEVNAGKSVADIVRRFKKEPGKTPIQSLGLDPYEVLGVNYGDVRSKVMAKYRTFIQTVHPDKGGSDFLFKVVQAAWESIR